MSPEAKATRLLMAIRDCMEYQSDGIVKLLAILDEMLIFDELAEAIRVSLAEEHKHTKARAAYDKTDQHSKCSSRVLVSCTAVLIGVLAIIVFYAGRHYDIVGSTPFQTTPSNTDKESRSQSVKEINPETSPASTPSTSSDTKTITEEAIYTPYQSGPEVVDLCIKKLKSSPAFNMPDDNGFMRRVAYVMSDFGRDMKHNGGIWQLSLVAFEDTMDHGGHKRLPRKYRQIMEAFGIDWKFVRYEDLHKPFYSALAARLYLSNYPDYIPPEPQVREQAKYWKFLYMRGDGDAQKFMDKVEQLERTNP